MWRNFDPPKQGRAFLFRPLVSTKTFPAEIIKYSQFGFDRVLCVCDENNLASEKVIQRCGGVLENKLYDPEEQVFVKRYWIFLSPYTER